MYFKLDNDDMESSKRRSIFISLIFILKLFILFYFLKTITVKNKTK